MNKAVFFDKDGTLVKDVPYNVDPAKVIFCPGIFEALGTLKKNGFLLIMVSNQSGLAKGFFNEEELLTSLDFIQAALKNHHAGMDDILYCPHHPQGTISRYQIECDCRKPKSGMFIRAMERWNIDPLQSWMVGDILDDMEAAGRVGLRTVLIDSGNETLWQEGKYRTPDFTVKELAEAVTSILQLRPTSPA